MKYFRPVLVLLALLGTASILFAERKSSHLPAAGSQPGAAARSTWVCPMWAWFSGSPPATTNAPAAQGPAMMYGGPGQYGPMGPGMMYGPAEQQDQTGAPQPTKNNYSDDSKPPAQ